MYKQIKPDPLLKNKVRYFWILDTSDFSQKECSHYLIPEVHSFILVTITGSFKIVDGYNGLVDTCRPLLVAGLKKPTKIVTSETLTMVGVSLFPGMSKALGYHIPHMSGGIMPIKLPLPEGPGLIAPIHYIDKMQAFIRDRLRGVTDIDNQTYYIKCLNALSRPGCCFHETCRDHGYSLRQLERSSLENTGYSPREFIAVRACTEARERIRRNTCTDLTDLAIDLGFCDQSHFCKTFKRWTGMSPGAYKRYWEHVKELFLKEANTSSTLW